MTAPRRAALLALTGLYFAQGLPYGFFTQALPALLRQLGMSLEDIGLASLLAAPWALKFLWAPVLDRVGTARRWILALQAIAALSVAALALTPPVEGASLGPLLVAVLVVNFVAATQDVATDGLAVSTIPPAARGLANAVQVGGYRVGMILGGGLLLVLHGSLGWTGTLLSLAALLLLGTAPLLGAPDLGTRRLPPADPMPWSWVLRPGALAWTALLVAWKLGDYLVSGMLRPWFVDLGLDLADIGVLLGTGGFVAGLLGAVAGGLVVDRVPRVPALVVASLLQVSGVAAYALAAALVTGPLDAPSAVLWASVLYEHFVGGVATAALFTAMMDASRVEHAGTDYTIQASIVVFASMGAASVSGYGAAALGYPGLFAMGAALALLAPLLLAAPATTALVRAGLVPPGTP